MEIRAVATKLPEAKGNVKGIASLTIGKDIVVRSIVIREGVNGNLFVCMPSLKTGRKGKDGKPEYKEICNPITKELREKMNEAILESYRIEKPVIFQDGREGYLSISANAYDEPFGQKVGDAKLYINDSFVVSGISVFAGKQGGFYTAMPGYKTTRVDENGKAIYQELCSINKGFLKELNKSIIDQYQKKKEERLLARITIRERIDEGKVKSKELKTDEKIPKEKILS